MLDLRIDPKTKAINTRVLLKGETAPIEATAKYELLLEDGEGQLRLSAIKADREWINVLLDELCTRKVTIPLPDKYVRLLSTIL